MEKEQICIKCGKKATVTVPLMKDKMVIKEDHYCVKHYVEWEGEGCLEGDLISMDLFKDYNMDRNIAEEIAKQFPSLAKKYKHVLDKILASKPSK